MSAEKFPTTPTTEEPASVEQNTNSIADLEFSLSKDIPTTPDRVYRSVYGDAALQDLNEHGQVRNAFDAGAKKKDRWGANVYWSRGVEGKYHPVQNGGYVIEAPHDVAVERAVRKDDVTAIYGKTEEGRVEDMKHHFLTTGSEEDRQGALAELRGSLTTGEGSETE